MIANLLPFHLPSLYPLSVAALVSFGVGAPAARPLRASHGPVAVLGRSASVCFGHLLNRFCGAWLYLL